ncbi:hypothetical protein BKA56DRAFT_431561, partial [Ilyonectria sp. MPI-CAGE-AT-0026]
CTDVTIGIDPMNCGRAGNACNSGELCVGGACLPLKFEPTLPCGTSGDNCLPGQWCYKGACTPIQVVTDPRHCGLSPVECNAGELCVNGVCIKIDIGSDPSSCGKSQTACNPGNWCMDGICAPFILGTSSSTCSSDKSCSLGAPCHNGVCQSYNIGTDPWNCGTDSHQCSAGELCVSGSCKPLYITTNPLSKKCHSGSLEYDGHCLPIHISTFLSACGYNSQGCKNGEVCVSGACVSGLEHTKDIAIVGCSKGPRDTNSEGSINNGHSWNSHGEEDTLHSSSSGNGTRRQSYGCPAGQVCGAGLSFDIFGDSQNCAGPGAGCPGNNLCCNNTCLSVDISTNAHLSDCKNNKCKAGCICEVDQTCRSVVIELLSSACEPVCRTGEICVSGTCINIAGDATGCGKSAYACPANHLCVLGTCLTVDTGSDPKNCGTGGLDCPAGTLCFAGACI